jgi:hypothetical protein
MIRTSLEQMERLLSIAENEGIRVRREWLGGVRGGLVRVGREPILFVDESLGIGEQLEQTKHALSQLDWSDTRWADTMRVLLNPSNGMVSSFAAEDSIDGLG